MHPSFTTTAGPISQCDALFKHPVVFVTHIKLSFSLAMVAATIVSVCRGRGETFIKGVGVGAGRT